jgi:glucokinase
MEYFFGADLGGNSAKIGFFTNEGAIVDEQEVPTGIDLGQEGVFSGMAKCIKTMAAKRGVDFRVCNVGMGVPGPVEENGFVESIVNLNMYDLYPAEILTQMLDGIYVIAANDANVAALGEMWQGAGKGHKNAMVITLGTGVGSGIVLDGKIVYGTKGLAGEIGHIKVNPNETERCNCGGIGCLDQIASATGVVRNTRHELDRSKKASILRSMENFTAKDIFDAARKGDNLAYYSIDYCMHFLGKCLSDVSHIIDPEMFIISGGLSKEGQYIIDFIYRHYREYLHLKKEPALFATATLGSKSGMYGAAKLVLDSSNS